VRGLRAGGVIIETQIAGGSPLAGRLVSEVAWPREAVLVAIERDGALLMPRGDFRLQPGDNLSIFATPASGPVGNLLDIPADEEARAVDTVASTGNAEAGASQRGG
jgi:Trk K+ transport system NAD-binding subunit